MLYLWPYLPKNCELLHQQMSALCFPSSTFPTDHNTLYTESHRGHYEDSNNDSNKITLYGHLTPLVKAAS